MPRSLGNVPVPVPGTLVQPIAAQTLCKGFVAQAIKAGGVANAGIVAIGVVGMVLATGVGVLLYLQPGDVETWQIPGEGIDASTLRIDAVAADDAIQLSIGG